MDNPDDVFVGMETGELFEDEIDGFSEESLELPDGLFEFADDELLGSSEHPKDATVLTSFKRDNDDAKALTGEAGLPLYEYSELEAEADFRLLVLKAKGGKGEDRIKCELRVVNIHDEECPQYEALSYRWGENLDVFEIWVEGKIVPVTGHLRHALQCLRHENDDRLLWVDALCINQCEGTPGAALGKQREIRNGQGKETPSEKTL